MCNRVVDETMEHFSSVGEYFLAELIESQDSSHQTIVAEVEGRAVGFMSITSEVDVEFLNECYQLEPFHGLKQPMDTDEVQTISTEGYLLEIHFLNVIFYPHKI